MKRILVLSASIPCLWIFFHVLSGGSVLTAGNLTNLFKYMTMVGILSTGMTLVMAAGFIDLSVGAGLGLLGAVAAWLLASGLPLGAALALSFVLALIMGLLHGSLVAYWKVPAFIATLSGLMAYMGAKQFLANPVIPIRNAWYLQLGQGYLGGAVLWALALLVLSVFAAMTWPRAKSPDPDTTLETSSPAPRKRIWLAANLALALGLGASLLLFEKDRGLPASVLIMLIGAFFAHGLTQWTRLGRHIYALGSNREAALYAGLPLHHITLSVFVVMAVYTWLAGLVATSQLMAAAADIGDYQELYAIAACVIGGTSLSGGTGKVWMSLLGALLMASILNGMEQVGLPSPIQKMILGLILTLAVAADQFAAKREA